MNLPTNLPIHHARFAQQYRERGQWRTEPVPDFLSDWARRTPGRIALVDHRGELTYAELHALVRRAAAGLWALGLRPGQTLALQLPNWREFAIFQQAAARIGVRYVPLLPQLRAADLAYLLQACDAVAIVAPDRFRDFDHAAMMAELQPALPLLREVFIVGTDVASGASQRRVVDFLATPWEEEHGAAVDAVEVDPDALRLVLFTSGTESKPKGVLHSFNTTFYPLRQHQGYFALGPHDVILTASPVGHGTGAIFGVEIGIFLGACVVLMAQWDPARAADTLARYRCTMMWGSTTFWHDLVNVPDVASRDLGAFRLALTAGAPVVRALVAQVRERLGARLVAAYGQSEGLNLSIHRLDDAVDKIVGSDGRINTGVEYKLVDAERRPVPAGEPGEFAYRGPIQSFGYLEAEHTARAFDADGYTYSGDLVHVDPQGYLRVAGRRKDVIIRGGENISPAEIEEWLYQHPAVADASVIGLADERLGQRACAVVVLRPGASLTLRELAAFMAERRIARFKTPESLVIVDALPRTASGKVRKEVLREHVATLPDAEAAPWR